MKKRWILIALSTLLTMMFLTACGGDKTYHNIAAQNNPYSMGKQSILIEASSGNADEPNAKFKQSISHSDIELGQALEGKSVTKVVFHSETSVTVTLEGDSKVAGGEGVYGTITVKHSGLESKGNSTCVVSVRAPEIKVSSYTATRKNAGDMTTHNIIAKLSLPVGIFADKAIEYVTLADGTTGNLTVERTDEGTLSLTVKNCNTATPMVLLRAEATTLEKEISVTLSLGGSAKFQ